MKMKKIKPYLKCNRKFTDKFINKAVKSGFTAKQAKFLSQVCFDV